MSTTAAPRSMSAPTRNLIRSNDSRSLWNYTLSPGWSDEEVNVLRLALMKYGVGKWTTIQDLQLLPGKTPAQCNLQTQRMIGQQSLGEFMGIRLDVSVIHAENAKKEGKRKNGFLVNEGDKVTVKQRAEKIAANRARFEISQEESDAIVIPKLERKLATTVRFLEADTLVSKKDRLAELQTRLEYLNKKLNEVHHARKETDFEKCSKCNPQRNDDMIGCERCTRWFHMSCAGIDEANVPEKWYCDHCTERRKFKQERHNAKRQNTGATNNQNNQNNSNVQNGDEQADEMNEIEDMQE